MKGNDKIVDEINKEDIRKGGDEDLKNYLFSILQSEGEEGLKGIKQYHSDFIKNGYDVYNIHKEVLHIWHGLNENGGKFQWQ